MLKISAKLQIKPLTRRILISFFHNNSAYKYNLRLLFDGNDFVEAQTKFYVKECEKEMSGNRKSRNVLHIRNDKASFRRYVKNLDTKV